MRLDEQRLRAEHVEKQTNTSLEVRIYDLESEIQNLMEAMHQRDKTIKQLTKSFEQTKQQLLDRENELSAMADDNSLEKELQLLRNENSVLKTKISTDAQSAQLLPNLVDNILADKNADIEKLRDELIEAKKQLHGYITLNFSDEELRALSSLKNQNHTFTEIVSLLQEPDLMRKAESQVDSLSSPMFGLKPNKSDSTPILAKSIFEPELSHIEKVTPLGSNYTTNVDFGKVNSTEIQPKSAKRAVHFNENANDSLQGELVELKQELLAKDEIIKEYNDRLEALAMLEENINQLQVSLESTEEALKNATESFERKQNELAEVEKQLRVDLAEKKMQLMQKEKVCLFIIII